MYLLHLKTRQFIKKKTDNGLNSGFIQFFEAPNTPISNPEKMLVWSLAHEYTPDLNLAKGTFQGDSLLNSTHITEDYLARILCDAGHHSIVNRINNCKKPLKWKITAGFLGHRHFTLVDAKSRSIIKFPKNALKKTDKTFKFKKIRFDKFWRNGNPERRGKLTCKLLLMMLLGQV